MSTIIATPRMTGKQLLQFSKVTAHLIRYPGAFICPAKIHKPKLLTRKETLLTALEKDLSIVRFGDGEMQMTRFAPQREGIHFQKYDPILQERLSSILLQAQSKVLVCYCNAYTLRRDHYVVLDYERNQKDYIRYVSVHRQNDVVVRRRTKMMLMFRYSLASFRSKTSVEILGEATCFFLQHYYEEYTNNILEEIFDLYSKMFRDRRVLIVAPKKPMFSKSFRQLAHSGIIQSPRHIDFLDIPNKDCFDHYDVILGRILSFKSIDAVILQAGPTATVLAWDLATKYGLIAYDVGSLGISMQKAADIHPNLSF